MGKKIKKVSITSNITEYKSLEKYFESMVKKGFMLLEVEKDIFKFERIDSRELDFMIRPICNESGYNNTDEEALKEYIKLYKYSGWDFCASNDVYMIFYKDKNMLEISIPNYIESKQAYKNIKKVFIKNDVKKMLWMMIPILLAVIPVFDFTYKDLFSNAALFAVMIPVFLMIGVIIRYLPAVIWFIKNRINLIIGRELTYPTNRIIKIRMKLIRSYCAVVIIGAIICVSGVCDNLVMKLGINNQKHQEVVLNLNDFGETIEPANKWTDNETSVLVPVNVKYYEYIGKSKKKNEIKEISTTYIKTINKSVADYIFDGYVKDSKEAINIYEVEEGIWNVQRGYYLYGRKSKIIIQKEKKIYILEGAFDFSNKEIVEIYEEKLGL